RKAEPGAAIVPRGRLVGLRERFEDALDLLRRNSDAGIIHGDAKEAPAPGRWSDREVDKTAFREFQRIVHQVADDLGEAYEVACDPPWRHWIDERCEIDVLAVSPFGKQADDRIRQLRDLDRHA